MEPPACSTQCPQDAEGDPGPGSGSAAAKDAAPAPSAAGSSNDKPGDAAPEDDSLLFLYSHDKGSKFGSSVSQKEKFEKCDLVVQTIALKKFRTAFTNRHALNYVAFCGLGLVKQYKQERRTLKGVVMGSYKEAEKLWHHASKHLPEGVRVMMLPENHNLDVSKDPCFQSPC